MFRVFLISLFPIILSANFNFNDNYEKQITILRKFDVDSSFLHNKFLRDVIEEYRGESNKYLFFRTMSDAVLFLPAIKNRLAESNIPNEFLYLAMVESRLITKARSSKKAAGIWQFIPSTAKLYGLKVNNYIDDRLDMIKSTEIAIRFLNDMYKRFDKWYLAAIAYNCGSGTLTRAIKKAGSEDLAILIDPDKKYLPKESRIYIRKILALALMEGSDEIFDSKYAYIFNVGNNSSLAKVEISGGERLIDIAKDINMDLIDLQNLNSHILLGVTPPSKKKYHIYIPYFKLPDFKLKYQKKIIYNGEMEYTVKKGDSLYRICENLNCDYEQIKETNRLKNNNLITGQKLIIPILYNNAKDVVKIEKNRPVISNIKVKNNRYLVKKGDTLYSIAVDFRIGVDKLIDNNNLESSNIFIGESLIVK